MFNKSSNKGFGALGALVVVLVLAVLGLAGFIVWDKSKKVQNTSPKNIESPVDSNASNEYKAVTPSGWANKINVEFNIAYSIPQGWAEDITVSKNKIDENVKIGYGSPVWIRYSSSAKKWETIDVDENNNPGIIRAQSLVTELVDLAEGKYKTSYYVTGDGLGAQVRLLVLKGDSIYQFSLPPTCEDVICEGDKTWTLKKMVDSLPDLIGSVDFQS